MDHLESCGSKSIVKIKKNNFVHLNEIFDKCCKNQKSEKFKITIPFVPYTVRTRSLLCSYNEKHTQKIRLKNLKYHNITSSDVYAFIRMFNLVVVDEILICGKKNIKTTYVVKSLKNN